MTIVGASQFVNSAILANTQGRAASTSGLISNLGTVDLLDVGRSVGGNNGIGLSKSARLANKQFLQSSTSTFNAIFSLGLGPGATVEGAQKQILALRSRFSADQLAPSLRQDDGGVAASENGQEVDTEA